MTTSAPGAVTVRERLGEVIGCAGEMPADEANRAPGHHPRPGHRRRGPSVRRGTVLRYLADTVDASRPGHVHALG